MGKEREYFALLSDFYCLKMCLFLFFCNLRLKFLGEMLEWLKRHAWKACMRQKRITSSNLVLSAFF